MNQASDKDFLQVVFLSRSRTAASLAEGQTRSGASDEISRLGASGDPPGGEVLQITGHKDACVSLALVLLLRLCNGLNSLWMDGMIWVLES